MGIFVFGRFVSIPGAQEQVAAALRVVMAATREEEGSISVTICQSVDDDRDFRVCSHWADEAALDRHLILPHVTRFSDVVAPLVEDAAMTRSRSIDGVQ